ncbi:MAG: sulfate adenylyltransferase subunit CysN [Pirellulaceae bacterium]
MSTASLPTTLAETQQFLTRHERKDLLRFVTCGSVDDGKSTLIGRLLLAAGAVYEDQLAALYCDSAKHGTVGQAIDPALLVDGLEDERKQGITIDVAYRYFQTPKRKFIIADSPGHEQYTRNMATAASSAEAAIVLVDARKGMLAQTRRHSFIASLLGVRRLILAVNKMDLVDYQQLVFEQIRAEFQSFVQRLDVEEVHYLPLSGLQGDNVAERSDNTPWYQGPSLLHVLENVPLDRGESHGELRFPVQRVVRPSADFRGYSGTVVSGMVKPGDRVAVLPGGRQTRVRSLVTFDGELTRASASAAITLTLDDEIDVARGDTIVHADRPPQVGRRFDATLVWMSQQPLVPGKSYWFKQTTSRTTAEVEHLSYRIDVNTLNWVEASSLQLNEIGCCRIVLHAPIAYDAYRHNRRTGAFILVDRVTHETVAAGMILAPESDALAGNHWNVNLRSQQLQITPSRITSRQRRQRYGHAAATLLLTGLSGAGKTTLGFALEERLFDAGYSVTMLDGQNLRHGISRDLGFSAEERSENLRRAAEIARLLNDAGMICIAAFVAPEADVRRKAKQVIGQRRLLHVHLSASPEVCRDRDLSGRYQAAERGEIVNFPGVTAPYEPPTDADLVLPTDQWSAERCLEALHGWLLPRLAAMEGENDATTDALND